MLSDLQVGLVREAHAVPYPDTAPFHPSEKYPEYPFGDVSARPNHAYAMVRRLFETMGLDREHCGTSAWNPLGDIIQPGHRVVLKPNFVSHLNYAFKVGVTDTDCLVTHGSIIRAVADYVAIALKGFGNIIVGDCPIQATRWEAVLELTGVDKVASYLRQQGIDIATRDYRLVIGEMDGNYLSGTRRQNRLEDYREVDLGSESALMPLIGDADRFAVADHDIVRMRQAHNNVHNRYLIPRDVLEADCIINLPKLKMHVKAGVTVAMKNLVGVIGHKDYLPHFRIGSGRRGYDEFPHQDLFEPPYWGLHHLMWKRESGMIKRTLFQATRAFNLVISRERRWEGAGGWYGNDTLWRTIVDINRAVLYAERQTGAMCEAPQRRHLAIVDGLIGGEREGPLAPWPVRSGMLIGGTSAAAVDLVAASAMGLDPMRIPSIREAFGRFRYPLTHELPDKVIVRTPVGATTLEGFIQLSNPIPFRPPSGWRGHIEPSDLVPAA